MHPLVLLSGIAFCSACIQTITGFGGMIIALTLGAHMFQVTELVDIFVPLGLLQSCYVVIVDRRHVPWKRLFRQIFPIMAVGTAVGYWTQTQLSGDSLKSILGVLVVVLASKELYAWYRDLQDGDQRPGQSYVVNSAVFGAGIMHGLMATGGPLLVYAMTQLRVDKSAFRSGLCAVFLLLNIVLVCVFFQAGRLQGSDLPDIAALLPALGIGILVGEWAHRKIDSRKFQLLIFVMLLGAGASLI
jgi:uncharacterized protein